ncbi:MAG: TadE/TadG family type IV pilus assembly protein [Bryobacteraceae bacterium]
MNGCSSSCGGCGPEKFRKQATDVPARPVTRRRARGQRGSAALEGALVILPLMAMLFALMDFSIAIFVQNVLHNAVREGVRFAITQQTGAGGQDNAIKAVVQSNAFGFLTDPTKITVQYLHQDPSTGALATSAGVGSNSQGNICVVSVVNYPWRMMVPIFQSSSPYLYSASSSDVMEAPPNGILPPR